MNEPPLGKSAIQNLLLYILAAHPANSRVVAERLGITIDPAGDLDGSWKLLEHSIEQAIIDDAPMIELELRNALALLVTHKEALGRKILPRDKRTAELVISTAVQELSGPEYGKPGGRTLVIDQAVRRLKGIPPKPGRRTVEDKVGRAMAKLKNR